MGRIRSTQRTASVAEHRQDACELAVGAMGEALQGSLNGDCQQPKNPPKGFSVQFAVSGVALAKRVGVRRRCALGISQ